MAPWISGVVQPQSSQKIELGGYIMKDYCILIVGIVLLLGGIGSVNRDMLAAVLCISIGVVLVIWHFVAAHKHRDD